jgi:DNA-binding transcriptional ArsR family regulator
MKMEDHSDLFSALGDPVRLGIVEQLCTSDEMAAGEIAKAYSISAPAISRHLKLLERSGIIKSRSEHRWRYYRLNRERFAEARDWFEQHLAFWQASLDRLERTLHVTDHAGDTE